jgi:hypothetical protein
MKRRWRICCGSLVLMAGLSPAARAQVPAPAPAAPPPAAVPPAAVGLPATPVAPAPAPANLWTFLCPPPDKMAACKARLCSSALGQMINNGLRPASAMSGGLVPLCCPAVSVVDLAKPADSAQGAAARMEQDEIEAKARRDAVRRLGRFDCHYWPEAQLALINALRADRNECVRLEAALALGNGCCCTKATIKALTISVSGSEEDGNPSETSPRVRAAADAALAHCLMTYAEVVPVPPEKKGIEPPPPGGERPPPGVPAVNPEKLPNIGKAPVQPAEYYKQVDALPREAVVEQGRHALDRGVTTHVQVVGQSGTAHSVTDIVRNAFNLPAPTAPVTETAPAEMVETHVQPVPVAPVSSAPPPLAPVSKTTPPVEKETKHVTPVWSPAPKSPPVSQASPPAQPAVQGPVIQTSADAPAAPAPVATMPDSPKRVPQYRTTTFIPSTPAPEKAPTVSEKPPVVQDKQQVVPAALVTSQAAPHLATASAQPSMPQSSKMPTQIMNVLQNGPSAQQRIWAATALSTCDGWTNPDVMQALVKAARTDTDPAVRAACVRCIGRMNVCTLPVMTAVQEMKADRDPTVRAEADLALRQLGEMGSVQMH